MPQSRVIRIEWGPMEGHRPRPAGSNARLGTHGDRLRVPITRITLDDGTSGFGPSSLFRETAQTLLGKRFGQLFSAECGTRAEWRAFEFPLWDLAGKRSEMPVYAMAAMVNGCSIREPFRAPCYDTSLYFDDLEIASDAEAAERIAQEAREGYDRGHRAFKIKVGRGARHMPLEPGTRRDIAVARAVREAVGTEALIMLDANNGYNLNLTKRVLDETADCQIYWMEEPFHEDATLLRDLKEWMERRELKTLIADGEGQASPSLLDWARDGLVDLIQFDIFGHGLTNWLETGRMMDEWGVGSAPHHYGGHFGNYAACHLAGAIRYFSSVEWDEATTPGLDASAYTLENGWVSVSNAPGFGLTLDEERFQRAVKENGYTLTAE